MKYAKLWSFFRDLDINFIDSSEINRQYDNGMTLLHYAVITNNYDLTLRLLIKGVDCNIKNQEGDTALHLAAQQQNLKIVALLLRHDAVDPCSLNNKGQTPHNILESHQELYQEIQETLKTFSILSPKYVQFFNPPEDKISPPGKLIKARS